MNCQAHHSFLRPHGVRVTKTIRSVYGYKITFGFQRHYKTPRARAMALRDLAAMCEWWGRQYTPEADYQFTVEPIERGVWRRCMCATHNALYGIDCDKRERRGERITRAPMPFGALIRGGMAA